MNEDRASRYHRLRRRAALASTVAGAAWLAWLLVSRTLGGAGGVGGRVPAPLAWPLRPVAAIALFTGAVALGWEVVSLPFVFYRSFLLDRKYGLSSEPLPQWLTITSRRWRSGWC